MQEHPTPTDIKHAIAEAIHAHNEAVRASSDRYNEKLRRQFPVGAISLIGDAIRQACEDNRMAAISEAGEKY